MRSGRAALRREPTRHLFSEDLSNSPLFTVHQAHAHVPLPGVYPSFGMKGKAHGNAHVRGADVE